MKDKRTDHRLHRALDLKDAVAVGLGAIIGAGIFVVTGEAAGISGPAFLVGLIMAGMVATFNGISSSQLAAVYPQSGGTYEYGYRLLSPGLGFAAGWMFLISKLTAAGVVAIGFGSYAHQLLPHVPPFGLSIAAILLLTAANYFGIKKAGMFNLFIVAITLLSLLYLIFSGIPEIRKENFRPFAPFGVMGIAEASALLFFAFTGYARIATLAEEVIEPEKTIPRAVIITILSAIVLYVAVSITAIGVIGAEGMADSISPLQEVANSLNSPAIFMVVTIGASTAMMGVLLSQILGISRMMLAMARRKDLMPALDAVHEKYRVPYLGILLTGTVILTLTIFGSFDFILRAASFTILIYYTITNLAALRQPDKQQLYGKAIPILGLTGCILMAFSLPLNVIASGFGLLFAGFGARWAFRKWR
jgi:basic amino acid/polyamine antiporter, APA family